MIESAAAFDNMIDGVENKKEEGRKSSVEDIDALDTVSTQGEDNEIQVAVEKELSEDTPKRVANSPAEEVAKQGKRNKLGLPELKNRVWVRHSESEETNNYEVVKSKEPENPQFGSFKCKNWTVEEMENWWWIFININGGIIHPQKEKL